jgi:retron-type reverse transcriptase
MGQVIDWDLSACFDTLQHDTLGAILRQRSKDGRGLEVIALGLHAGLLDGKAMGSPDPGSPQGAVRSPVLANVDGRLFGRKGTVASMTP